MPSPRHPQLAVIGERAALGWVLERQQIAFPEPRYRNQFHRPQVGERLYIYTTRGCFKNPSSHRGRVIAAATVTGEVGEAVEPIVVQGRPLPYQVAVSVDSLAPFGEGFNVSDAVAMMTSFPKRESWSVYLRRSLFQLTDDDSRLLDQHLARWSNQLEQNKDGYLRYARMDHTHAQ